MEQTRIQGAPAQRTQEARAPQAKAAGEAQRAGGAPQDGFALLLASLGQEGAEMAGEGLAAVDLDGTAGALADPAEELSRPDDAAPAADAAALAWLLAGQAGSPGLAQQVPGSTPGGAPLGTSLSDAGALAATLALQQAGASAHWTPTTLVAETGRLDGAADLGADWREAAGGAQAAKGRGLRAAAHAGPGSGLDAASGRGAAPERATLTRADAPSSALAGGLNAATPQTQHASAAMAAAGSGAERNAALPVRAPGAEELPAPAMAMAGAAEGNASAPRGTAVRAGEDATTLQVNAEPAAERSGPGAGEPAPAAPDAAWQASADAAEAQLTDRMAYWVHQQTQNAALTLDRDGQPVQVRVALTGDQAHITFRSDEAQARQLLDAGTAQLRALLDAQGLQLAGVTIGASAGQQQGDARSGPGGEPPAGARQGSVRSAPGGQAISGAAPARSAAAGNRSVDVFV